MFSKNWASIQKPPRKNNLTKNHSSHYDLILWCPKQDLNLHLEARLAPEASASANSAIRA